MCSRFLPLAAAFAVLVACGRNQASAATDGNNSPETIDSPELALPAVAASPAEVTVASDSRQITFDGPYYKTNLCWQQGITFFQDMHMNTGGKGATDLPISDSHAWSSAERQAGIYFMESLPGYGLNLIKCQDPENIVRGAGTVSCQWKDAYGYRSFKMSMDENSATIQGFDPQTGEPANNWFLSLITAREKGDELPFTVIVPERINSSYKGRDYSLEIGQGKVSINGDDTPPVFNIYPENGTVKLVFHD